MPYHNSNVCYQHTIKTMLTKLGKKCKKIYLIQNLLYPGPPPIGIFVVCTFGVTFLFFEYSILTLVRLLKNSAVN